MIYLRKANNDVISHCSCGDGRISIPAQMDCPWCGCGWLFSCITCRKAFTFAEGIELRDNSLEDFAVEDMKRYGRRIIDDENIRLWVDAMGAVLEGVEVGKKYAIIDWTVFPVDSTDVEFDGLYAHHRFKRLPQVDAMDDIAVLDRQLGCREYWSLNALPEEDSNE